MTKMMRCVLPLALAVACCGAWAQAETGGKVRLQYTPKVGEKCEAMASSSLKDVQMNGISLGPVGKASGTMRTEVTKVDEETGDFTLKATFDGLSGEFQGQEREPKPIAPLLVTLSRAGAPKEWARETDEDQPVGGLEAITSGGLPLDLMSLLWATVQFPETEVAVGDTWETEDTRELPIVGKVTLRSTSHLVKIEGTVAFVETEIQSDLEPFETESPFMAGKMKVQSGRVVADQVVREYDMSRSVVRRAKGDLRLELTADMGFGVPTELAAIAGTEVEPVQPEAEGEAATEAPETEATGPAVPAKLNEAAAPKHGVQLGALAADGSYDRGQVKLGMGVDMAKSRVAARRDKYGLLAKTTRLSCAVGAGVAGEQAGKLTLQGELSVGPVRRQGTYSIDLRAAAERAVATAKQWFMDR